MSKYVEPVFHLQITVPHIALPSGSQHRPHAEGVAAEDQQRYTEQVRILPPGVQGEALPLAVQARHFRIFQIKGIAAQGHALMLQILRMYPGAKQQKHAGRTGQLEQLRLSDVLAFTVEFRRFGETSQVSQAEHANTPAILTPGLNSVVIFLAEDGTPTNYSIDGAKS